MKEKLTTDRDEKSIGTYDNACQQFRIFAVPMDRRRSLLRYSVILSASRSALTHGSRQHVLISSGSPATKAYCGGRDLSRPNQTPHHNTHCFVRQIRPDLLRSKAIIVGVWLFWRNDVDARERCRMAPNSAGRP